MIPANIRSAFGLELWFRRHPLTGMMRSLGRLLLSVCCFSCTNLSQSYEQLSELPPVFPDYADITIPCNIAPLNFMLQMDDVRSFTVKIKGVQEYVFQASSNTIRFPEKQWKQLLEKEKGNTLEVYVKADGKGKSFGYLPFLWTVAKDSIDRYLSYRLIEPAYEVWNKIRIEERDLQSFSTRVLGDNNITDRACMNCHTVNHAALPASFMHLRGKNGGTIYAFDGRLRKINTKTPETEGAAVYGEIASDGRFGIFTTAEIVPILHALPDKHLEVYDSRSNLILLDFENNTVSDRPCITGEDFQETFPCFSADNRTIYFCRAPHLPQPDSTLQVHYDLYSIAFDPSTGELGDSVRLVFDAAAVGKSVSFPKCSPDGRFLLFAVSDYGTFPIWHVETDLWLLNLETGMIDKMEKTNGENADSYHSWSGNSRWFAFASKRDDGLYGRPYFAYVNDDGSTTKAFVLPQKMPEFYLTTLKSFNIPELYDLKESYNAHDLRKIYKNTETENFKYK
ncbi:MAG: hypothetical protein LBR67_04020 [Dysgonamonadaceae bacterium]|jgi:hypothetical protein|nr:hypothetical protein [Dysgonamonadaceae bacterium]